MHLSKFTYQHYLYLYAALPIYLAYLKTLNSVYIRESDSHLLRPLPFGIPPTFVLEQAQALYFTAKKLLCKNLHYTSEKNMSNSIYPQYHMNYRILQLTLEAWCFF